MKRINFIKDADGEITGCEIEGGSSVMQDVLRELARMRELLDGGETTMAREKREANEAIERSPEGQAMRARHQWARQSIADLRARHLDDLIQRRQTGESFDSLKERHAQDWADLRRFLDEHRYA